LQTLAEELNITDLPYEGEKCQLAIDDLSVSVVRDPQKCISCRRCVSTCKYVQTVGVIEAVNRGFNTSIEPAFGKSISEIACVNCGQCIAACPVGALTEKSAINDVWAAIADPDKYVIAQTAPAIRAAIGEEFGLPIGTPSTSNMVGSMLQLGLTGYLTQILRLTLQFRRRN
jgi:NADP-reducing hydrogenase subunit HndD